jgi:hypothetical protein
MAIDALWSRKTYEGSLGYPEDATALITTWDGVTSIPGFAWFASNPEEELMQVVATDPDAEFTAVSDFVWQIGATTYTIPMINLVEP